MKLFSEADFLQWTKQNDAERNLSEENYVMLYDYLTGHGYALWADSENFLYRFDVDDDGVVSYSIDDLICDVSSWNFSMLQEYEYSIKILDISDPELSNVNNIIKVLEEQEEIIDSMYRTTNIGKMIVNACHKIAEEGV